MSFDLYTSLLKMFDEFHESSKNVHLSYDLTDPKLQEIREKYNLYDIAGTGDDFSKVKNLLFWLSKNCYHNGNFSFQENWNALNLLKYSYQKGNEYGINCMALSITLTECLLSLGFVARTIYIMPFAPYDLDNHVITHVYLNGLKKWVMLDPTFNCYVMNKDKTPLNLFEVRELLANQEYFVFNKEIKYNDEIRDENSQETKEYYAKDTFYFMTKEKSCFSTDETENRVIHIMPSGFDVKKKEVLSIEYRIKQQGATEQLQNWLEDMKENKFLYSTPFDLLKSP